MGLHYIARSLELHYNDYVSLEQPLGLLYNLAQPLALHYNLFGILSVCLWSFSKNAHQRS